jgi:micrococcal nuclease
MKIFNSFLYLILYLLLGAGTWFLFKNYLSSSSTSKPYIANFSAMPISEYWQFLDVHDGDTIKVKKGKITEIIRLCGIDAPEISQALGKESRDYLRQLISAKSEVQISISGTDRYNRKIGEIFLGEKFINEEMVKAGMAYHYVKYSINCPNRISLKNGEAIAKSKKVGIWNGEHEKPWDYRKSKRNKTISKGNL